MTPCQMREARRALGWSRIRLAAASNTTTNFIKIYEEEGRIARINLRQFVFKGLEAIEAVLVEHGIEFDHRSGEACLRQSCMPEFAVPAAHPRDRPS